MSKHLTQSFLFLLAAELVFNLSGYVIHAGLGRILGVAEYGRYSIVIGFTTMVIILVSRGIPTAMAKRLSEHAGDWQMIAAIKRTAAKLQFFVITALTTAFYFAAPLIAGLFGDPSLTQLFQIAAFVIPAFALSSFHVLYFNGLKRFGAMSMLKLSRGLLRIAWIVGLAFIFNTEGALWGAVFAPLSVFFVALAIDALYFKKQNAAAAKAYPPTKLLSFAGQFLVFLLFYEIFVRVDLYLVKIILADDALTGLYNAAMTTALIPFYLLFALAFILFPTISTLTSDGDKSERTKLINSVLRLMVIFLVPAIVLMHAFAEPLVTLLFGTQFTPAAAVLPLLLGGTLFGTFFYILASVFNGAGKTRIPATIAACAVVASIVLNTIYLPQFQLMAAGVIFSFVATLMGFSALLFARIHFNAGLSTLTTLKVVAAALAIYLLAPLFPAGQFTFILSGAILFTLYLLLLVAFGELTKSDLNFLQQSRGGPR